MSKHHTNILFFRGGTRKIWILPVLMVTVMIVTGCSHNNSNNSETSSYLSQETAAPELPTVEITTAPPAVIINEVDYSSYFEGRSGAAVFYNPKDNQYDIYNLSLAETQHPPCSTFKVISSLLGLERGVIDVQNSVRAWSGEQFWMPEWNQNIDFSAAFRSSCVWYFRQVIDDLGKDAMQEGLAALDYGNQDISDWEGRLNTNSDNRALTGFWIESSLKISPKQQTEVMARIFEPNSVFREEITNQLKSVMQIEQTVCSNKIYGKTGSGKDNNVWVDAWFVGLIEREDGNIYFATYLGESAPYEISSKLAKEITIKIAGDFYGD